MQIFKVVMFLCFVLCVKGQEDQAENHTTPEHTTTICCSTTVLDLKNNSANATEPDTEGDIILTATPETTVKNATFPEEQPTTTEIIVTTKTVSSTEKETVPPTSNWTACSSNPCKNGATCLDNSAIPGAFSCSCKHGYVGVTCAIKDECFVHENGGLCHRGKCTYSDDRRLRSCRCFSKMYWDDEGKECKEAQPPCFPNPCLNGGICIVQNSTFECQCETGYEGEYCAIRNTCGEEDHCENGKCVTDTNQAIKYCKCDDNFYWNEDTEECETVVRPCKPNPCKHSGICLPISADDFNCTCNGTYSGSTCEEVNFCLDDKEKDGCNNGICIKIGDTKLCQCDTDYYLDETTHTCKENHKPCQPNPCANDGLCTALPDSTYNCTCSKGFSGKDCKDLDLCILDGGNAFCGEATCVNDLDERSYHCNCSSGQYFDYAERKCRGIDLCPLMNCGSTEICENSQCGCRKHFQWNNETHACERKISISAIFNF
ncbi:adhesive plaque matrix protein 2-like [Stegodyphus dumicola]|uniref:adhesive plaque matrix protein 2-like n=1 Tax=Stegodyphus dumicola TaxID=202533 RepID=UPI0015AF732A|nr:adhesive plaque matrix protein 2-like [Stegodyphus dumicola]